MARESFGSRFGFIMTTAGFSVGLGNIWRFPYLTGENGGGAFVITYLLICIFISIPLFIAEVSMGRKTQLNPIQGMQKLAGQKSPWVIIGWMGIIASFFVMTYYLEVLGWVLAYIFKVLFGIIDTSSPESVTAAYNSFISSPGTVLLYTIGVAVITGLISARGLKEGLEKACKIMMPMLMGILVLLAIRALTLPGAWEGVKWYLTPDFSKVNTGTILIALGQSFFSVGIASAAAFIYGSYLNRDSNLPTDLTIVVFCDVAIALVAGLVIFPAIFSFGLQPDAGTSLLFLTLPQLFATMPVGNLFGGLFFFLMFIAGVSSALGYLEAVVLPIAEVKNIDRKKTVWGTLAAMVIVGIGPIMSFGPWKHILIYGRTLFDFADFLSGNVLMTIGGLLIALYTGYVWKFENFREEANVGAKGIKIPGWFKPMFLVVIPVSIGFVILRSVFNMF